MQDTDYQRLIKQGMEAGGDRIDVENNIWCSYSSDKINIAETLIRVIRTLNKEFTLSKKMRAISIGSGNEPQFRILETAFRGWLYLLDIEKEALDLVLDRVRRQFINHVTTILADMNKIFLKSKTADDFLMQKLGGKKLDCITLDHSMYYCETADWPVLYKNLYENILASKGAIHAVIMSSRCTNRHSTTWLYNHFVEKYFGQKNDQDLLALVAELRKNRIFSGAQILSKTSRVEFSVNNFDQFMAVVWMIMLYPEVHQYTEKQKEEITDFVYREFWKTKTPLLQEQDHLVIYRGIDLEGLI